MSCYSLISGYRKMDDFGSPFARDEAISQVLRYLCLLRYMFRTL